MSERGPHELPEHTHQHHLDLRAEFAAIHAKLERIFTMSATLATDLAALTAAVTSLADEVTAGLTANSAAIAALQAQIAAGNPVTAADLATLESNTAAVQAAVGTLKASLNP